MSDRKPRPSKKLGKNPPKANAQALATGKVKDEGHSQPETPQERMARLRRIAEGGK